MATQIHSTAVVDDGAQVGEGTSIWHFSHISSGAKIGQHCSLGQNVFVADGVTVGDHVKIQNNVSLYSGVELEDFVFCGPSCVFTNVVNPRCEVPRRDEFQKTLVQLGATIGANATIVCGTTIGRFALVAAGAVVTSAVTQYALMLGVPARQQGWFSRHGQRLAVSEDPTIWVCPQSGWQYKLDSADRMTCVDWPENKPLAN